MKYFSIFFILTIFLLNCGGEDQSYHIKPQEITKDTDKSNGIIIGRISIDPKSKIGKSSDVMRIYRSFGLKLSKGFAKDKYKLFVVNFSRDKGFFALYLPAGFYNFSEVVFEDSNIPLEENSLTFEAKADQVTYIGELSFFILANKVKLGAKNYDLELKITPEVKDNMSQATNYFKSKNAVWLNNKSPVSTPADFYYKVRSKSDKIN